LKTIPVYHLVSIGLPSTIIETTAKNAELFNKVLHAEHIPDKILSLVQSHQNKSLTPYQQRKIITLLLEQHTPTPSFDALPFYKIHPSELLQGVPCLKCTHNLMEWRHGKWVCPLCYSTSKDAHKEVILDHLQLQHTLTNRECRALLHVDSVHVIKRLLNAMDLPHQGEGKKRVYFLDSKKGAF
jgi:hypothetical protein